MKILFITERFPYPLDTGGNVRTFHLLKALSAEHQVTLLAQHPDSTPEAILGPVRKLCTGIELVQMKSVSAMHDALVFCASVLAGRSFVLERRRRGALTLALRRIFSSAEKSRFDAVHFNHLDAGLYEDVVPRDVLRILDQHNVVTNQVRTTLAVEKNLLRRAVLFRESGILCGAERDLCNRMNLCITCSDSDAASLREMGVRAPIMTVANGVDLRSFAPDDRAPVTRTVVFVGTLDYDPCEKAVAHFCEAILPSIHQRHPDVRFLVVGRNPSARLRRLAQRDERIILTGRVDDVRPYVRAASVFVAPLLSGSGTRLKILEALALGTPVVTTRIGAEGIEATPGGDLLITDHPDDFAGAVSAILEQPELAIALKLAGRTLVEQKYGWCACCKPLIEFYRGCSAEV